MTMTKQERKTTTRQRRRRIRSDDAAVVVVSKTITTRRRSGGEGGTGVPIAVDSSSCFDDTVVIGRQRPRRRRQQTPVWVMGRAVLLLLPLVTPQSFPYYHRTASPAAAAAVATAVELNDDDYDNVGRLSQCTTTVVDDGTSCISPPTLTNEEEEEESTSTTSYASTCTLYLGPSSIPNAGLGIYTSIPLSSGSYIGEPDLMISIPDEIHPQPHPWLVEDVHWEEELPFRYDSSTSSSSFVPGFGAACNCHFGLLNTGFYAGYTDHGGDIHRSKDPGVGAFAYEIGVGAKAEKDLVPGEELFIDYGYKYFNGRMGKIGPIPFEEDFERANDLIGSFLNRRRRYALEEEGIINDEDDSREAEEEMWQLVRNSIESDQLRMALPRHAIELQQAYQIGAGRYSLPQSIRSHDWFEEHAMCIDNIYPSKSTIHGAGHGAFARRFLPQGTTIAPVPLMQLHRESLRMAPPPRNVGELNGMGYGRNEWQLMYNYCYGDDDESSDIVLLPYGPQVNFINHNSTDVNAELRWVEAAGRGGSSDDEDAPTPMGAANDALRTMNPEELLEQSFGLLLEVVALRDIKPDEEIFLDYGDAWEVAWNNHVNNYIPPPRAKDYVDLSDYGSSSSSIAAEDDDDDETTSYRISIRTVEEQRYNPYPPNLDTYCKFRPTDDQWEEAREQAESIDNSSGDDDNDGDGGRPADGRGPHTVQWTRGNDYKSSSCLRPCRILSTSSLNGGDMVLFDAEIFNDDSLDPDCLVASSSSPEEEEESEDEDETTATSQRPSWIVRGFPSSSFQLWSRRYSKDHFLPNAFRHTIGLPEGVFPDAWKKTTKKQ